MVGSKQSILKTILYSDIFHYPLSKEQLWQYLIDEKHVVSKDMFATFFSHIQFPIAKKNNLYYLANRENMLTSYKEKKEESRKKMIIAKQVAKLLGKVPSICFIGVSGALAMENADRHDDIDFFIITKKKTVWITRACALLLLQLAGKRRKRQSKEAPDTICLNMFLDETALCLPRERQNIYAAHEVVQVRSLFERDGMYTKFLMANNWVKQYLPNSITAYILKQEKRKTLLANIFSIVVTPLEYIARGLQLWYMKSHITSETVSDSVLAFHPFDYTVWVLREYKKRLKKYGAV